MHISRYIHLNPRNFRSWPYSSFCYYLGEKSASWLSAEKILELFENDITSYVEFLDDYVEYKMILEEIKTELAGIN